MEDCIYLPGSKAYYKDLIDDMIKYPELQVPPQFLEMTREEQQKQMWIRLKKLMEINPDRYFDSLEVGLPMPQRLTPGICPTSLHFGMFLTSVLKIGSDD